MLYDTRNENSPPYSLEETMPPIIVSSAAHPAMVVYYFNMALMPVRANRFWRPWCNAIVKAQRALRSVLVPPRDFIYGFRPSFPHQITHEPRDALSVSGDPSRSRQNNVEDKPGSSPTPQTVYTSTPPDTMAPGLSHSSPSAATGTSSLSSLKRKRASSHGTPSLDRLHTPESYIVTWLNGSSNETANSKPLPSPDGELSTSYARERSTDPNGLLEFTKQRSIYHHHPLRSSNDWIFVRYRVNAEDGKTPPVRYLA